MQKSTCKWFLAEKHSRDLEYMTTLFEKVSASVNRRYIDLEAMASAELMRTIDIQERSNK